MSRFIFLLHQFLSHEDFENDSSVYPLHFLPLIWCRCPSLALIVQLIKSSINSLGLAHCMVKVCFIRYWYKVIEKGNILKLRNLFSLKKKNLIKICPFKLILCSPSVWLTWLKETESQLKLQCICFFKTCPPIW